MTLRSMRNDTINDAKERTWSLPWCYGDQLEQLIEMLKARYGRDTLVQLLRHIAIMSESQTRCSGDDRVWCEFLDWVTGGDDYVYKSKLWSHDRIHMDLDEERTREDGDVKRVLAPEEKLVELSSVVGCGGSPSSRLRLGTVTKPRVTMGEKLNVV